MNSLYVASPTFLFAYVSTSARVSRPAVPPRASSVVPSCARGLSIPHAREIGCTTPKKSRDVNNRDRRKCKVHTAACAAPRPSRGRIVARIAYRPWGKSPDARVSTHLNRILRYFCERGRFRAVLSVPETSTLVFESISTRWALSCTARISAGYLGDRIGSLMDDDIRWNLGER